MSTDESRDLVLIAEETACCNGFLEPGTPRTSAAITLSAGQRYFVRMLYKEGGGGDYGEVAWRKEGDTTPANRLTPIPGRYLSSVVALPKSAEGVFLTRFPAPGAMNVRPDAEIRVVHLDGRTAWTASNVTLAFDGVPVVPMFVKEDETATIVYRPSQALGSEAVHTVTLGYPDPAGNAVTQEWSFVGTRYVGPLGGAVAEYPGWVFGSAASSSNQGGWTGNLGDGALDLTLQGGYIQVMDAGFLQAVNAAMADDELSLSLWLNEYEVLGSTAIALYSSTRRYAFRTHVPWSDGKIYFDTSGCCGPRLYRLFAPIADLPGYAGGPDCWRHWRLYVFTKKGAHEQIWVDRQPLVEGDNTDELPTDVTLLHIGSEEGGALGMHARVDDVAVFSKALTPAQVASLLAGTKPSALAPSAGLLAYWDFDGGRIEPPLCGSPVVLHPIRVRALSIGSGKRGSICHSGSDGCRSTVRHHFVRRCRPGRDDGSFRRRQRLRHSALARRHRLALELGQSLELLDPGRHRDRRRRCANRGLGWDGRLVFPDASASSREGWRWRPTTGFIPARTPTWLPEKAVWRCSKSSILPNLSVSESGILRVRRSESS